MNIAGSSRGTTSRNPLRRGISKSGLDSDSNNHNHLELNFYATPPNYELSIDEFESLALARLKVLRKIEELKTRNITGKNFILALDKTIHENLKTVPLEMNSMLKHNHNINNSELRHLRKKRDVASHFILRAAYCKTEDLRRWFLTQETFLFKYQLDKIADSPTSGGLLLRQFLNENELFFDIVSDEEKTKVKSYLTQIPTWISSNSSSSGTASANGNGNGIADANVKVPSIQDVNNTTYFKIHFSEASDLIAKRQCYVHRGYAYVPLPKIVSIVTAKFRMNLSRSLAKASRVFDQVSTEYTQIAPLLKSMNSQYVGKEYTGTEKQLGEYELTADNVEQYASSMPLCMSQLHNGLKQDSKLRHHGRLQYGLFLKGAGMTMEESLIFFQQHFTRIMSNEKYQKEYTYNIRHMYGKEGKRTSYSAYNCRKIILGAPPSGGDHHGCPYKHYDTDHLASLLNKMKIGTVSERDQIMTHKKSGHYNLACMEHFKAVHPDAISTPNIDLAGVGDHPNAWYAASVAYNKVKNGTQGSKDVKSETNSL